MSAEGKDDPSAAVEAATLSIDYAKHLTTLSTGSIVLLTVFAEKVFPTPIWTALMAVSIMGSVLTILVESSSIRYSSGPCPWEASPLGG